MNKRELKRLQKKAEFVAMLLEQARLKVKPIVDAEREAEKIPQGLMEFRMD